MTPLSISNGWHQGWPRRRNPGWTGLAVAYALGIATGAILATVFLH